MTETSSTNLMKNINSGSLKELNEEQIAILKQFRVKVADIKEHESDHYFLRWLIARKFDINKAEDMLRAHMKTMEDVNADYAIRHWVPSKVIQQLGFTLIGFDKEGNSTFIILFEFMDLKGLANSATLYEQLLTGLTEIERALILMKERKGEKTVLKCNCILDFNGFRLPKTFFVLKQHLKILQMFESNFPEILNKVIIINISALFYAWFNFIKFALDARTLNKLHFFQKGSNLKEILDFIDADVLPVFLGGNRTDPDGDLSCSSLFQSPPVSKICKTYYYSHQNPHRILWNFNSIETEIERRSYFNLVLDITDSGSWIHWIIRTRGYNLGFGIYYSGNSVPDCWDNDVNRIKSDLKNWIQPLEIFDTCPTPTEWQVICKSPGKYICHFDNTYSWITSKQLAYVVSVISPDGTVKYITDT